MQSPNLFEPETRMPLPPRAPVVVRPIPPGQKFRTAIEQALQDGIDADALLLRLTLGDFSRLKRDRDIAAGDIRFSDGETRYLGVKVVGGDVEVSTLAIVQS
jgi:hypothetical protein